MNYAVIAHGGKQYKVSKGSVLELDRIAVEPGKEFTLESVLLAVDGDSIQYGTPELKNVTVKAKVLDQIKGEKIRISQYKAKVRHRRTIGFRAQLTKVEILSLENKAKKESK